MPDEDKLTFKKALDISLVLEAATKDTIYRFKQQHQPLLATQFQSIKYGKGRNLHQALSVTAVRSRVARHQNIITRTSLRKKWHLAKVCCSTKNTPSQSKSEPSQTNKLISDTQVPEEYQLFSIQQEGTNSHAKP